MSIRPQSSKSKDEEAEIEGDMIKAVVNRDGHCREDGSRRGQVG